MALTVQEFWQLVVASGLHDEENCRRLADAFAQGRQTGAIARGTALPEWMLASGAMTRYQAKILLAGKPGPFVYADYLVSDRLEDAGLPGLFRAVHRPTGVDVVLWFLSGALDRPDHRGATSPRSCDRRGRISPDSLPDALPHAGRPEHVQVSGRRAVASRRARRAVGRWAPR